MSRIKSNAIVWVQVEDMSIWEMEEVSIHRDLRGMNLPNMYRFIFNVLVCDPRLADEWPTNLQISSYKFAYMILKALGFRKTRSKIESVDNWRNRMTNYGKDVTRVPRQHLQMLIRLVQPRLFPSVSSALLSR